MSVDRLVGAAQPVERDRRRRQPRVPHRVADRHRHGDGVQRGQRLGGPALDGEQAGERVLQQPAALAQGRPLQRRVGHLAGGGDVAAVEVAADLERAGVRLPDPGPAPHPVLVERRGEAGQRLVELAPPPAPVALPDARRHRHEQRAAGVRLRPGPRPEVAEVVVGDHPDEGRHHPEQPVVDRPEPVALEGEAGQRDGPVAVGALDHRLEGERSRPASGRRARSRPAPADPSAPTRSRSRPCM